MKKIFGVALAILVCVYLVSCKDEGKQNELSRVIVNEKSEIETQLVINSRDDTEVVVEKEQIPDKDETSEEKETEEVSEISEVPLEYDYVLNTNTRKFHYPSCSSALQTKDKNKAYHKGTREELIDMEYDPCGRCKP